MGWHSEDHLIGPYILPDRLTGPRYLIFFCQSYWTAHTLPLRLVLPCGSSKMEPPRISVFLFGITWMQHVVNDGLAVEVQCISLPRSPDLSCLELFHWQGDGNEILRVRDTRKQRRGT
ncbi:hypothetical protein TNCV_4067411 [Trichonephila clavipes]|nr:hypothetical protein TNCV_4067411 [Trichonephila clavipes]